MKNPTHKHLKTTHATDDEQSVNRVGEEKLYRGKRFFASLTTDSTSNI